MGIFFRKVFKLGPINITVSKSGVGFSVGKGGVRVGANTNGRKTFSASVPGTGISIRKSLGTKRRKKNISSATSGNLT